MFGLDMVDMGGVRRLEGTREQWERAALDVEWPPFDGMRAPGVRVLRKLGVLLGLRGCTKLKREALLALIVATMVR